jgi:hypothetical protein
MKYVDHKSDFDRGIINKAIDEYVHSGLSQKQCIEKYGLKQCVFSYYYLKLKNPKTKQAAVRASKMVHANTHTTPQAGGRVPKPEFSINITDGNSISANDEKERSARHRELINSYCKVESK